MLDIIISRFTLSPREAALAVVYATHLPVMATFRDRTAASVAVVCWPCVQNEMERMWRQTKRHNGQGKERGRFSSSMIWFCCIQLDSAGSGTRDFFFE